MFNGCNWNWQGYNILDPVIRGGSYGKREKRRRCPSGEGPACKFLYQPALQQGPAGCQL